MKESIDAHEEKNADNFYWNDTIDNLKHVKILTR